MHPSKAPGHDGLPAIFFQKYWSCLGEKLTTACFRILYSSGDMGDINDTLLIMVPKVKDPLSVSDFRPISLYMVLYKIISKMIVNRLKNFLPEIISPSKVLLSLGTRLRTIFWWLLNTCK